MRTSECKVPCNVANRCQHCCSCCLVSMLLLLLAQCQLLLRSSLSVPTSVSVGGRWQWPPCAVNAPPSPQDHQSLLELSPLHSFHVTRPSCPSFSPPLGHVPCLRVSVHVCDARHVRWPCGVKGVRLCVVLESWRRRRPWRPWSLLLGVHGVHGHWCHHSYMSCSYVRGVHGVHGHWCHHSYMSCLCFPECPYTLLYP